MSEREMSGLPPGDDAARVPVDPRRLDGEAGLESDPVARLLRLAGARPPVPAERAGRVEATVRDAWLEASARRRRARRLAWGGAVAAAAALAIAVGAAFWPRSGGVTVLAEVERVSGAVQLQVGGGAQPLVPGARLTRGAVLLTDAGGRAALRLAGGSSLRLDVESRLRLDRPGQLALDRGAVYVDSQGGPSLTVQTPWGEVEERGTQFEVRLAGQTVRVRVREGGVVLAGGGGSWQAPAGEELVLAADGRLSRGKVPFHGEPWSWVQEIAPAFHLQGRTLGEFLTWVGRETGRQVRWQEPGREAAKSGHLVHGSLDGMTPDESLAAVLPTVGLAQRVEGSAIVLFDHSSGAVR
jgi:ferric-dicitrate binding protein FerR (iron transport regulator)